jgi:farnesyl-diphosphate farnesyltransferase
VEDDMTLDLALKTETLRHFFERLDEPGWCFTQSGPNEKDRQVLVGFDAIGAEFRSLEPRCAASRCV